MRLHWQMEDTTEKNVCNENIEKLHKIVQHTKQDAKVGLAYMKWNEIQSMWRKEGIQEGKVLFAITIMRKMLNQNQTPEEISQFTELPIELTKEIADQICIHPEWGEEQIFETVWTRKDVI